MKHFFIITTTAFLFLSCNSQKTADTNSYSKVCIDMLAFIHSNDVSHAIPLMDSVFLLMAKRDSIDIPKTFATISEKLNSEYPGETKYSVISEENTFHEDLPSKFLIVKLDVVDGFGYYYFYVNKKSGKILLLGTFDLKHKRG